MSSHRAFARRCIAALFCAGCATPSSPPGAVAPAVRAAGASAAARVVVPRVVAVAPATGGGATKPAGLAALEDELHRAMTELGTLGKPPPYFIGYEVHDRT